MLTYSLPFPDLERQRRAFGHDHELRFRRPHADPAAAAPNAGPLGNLPSVPMFDES